MRRALLVSLAAAACTASVASPPRPPVDWASLDKPEVVDAGAARATAQERQVATAYAKAFSSDGFRGLASLLSEEAHATFDQKNALGRDKVVALHQDIFGAFDHRALGLRRVFVTDSEQAIEWTLTGVQALDWNGIPATHKAIAAKGVTLVWTRDDGSISDVHVYFDENVVKGQLGVGAPELQTLPPPAIPSGPPRMIEKTNDDREATNLAVLRSMIDALEDNKEAIYTGAVTSDVIIQKLEQPQPVVGVDAVRAYFTTMRKAIGQLDTLAQGGFGAGDFAVLEYSISGAQIAPLEHVPFARGRAIRMHVVDVAELRDGKIDHLWRYDDPAEVATGP